MGKIKMRGECSGYFTLRVLGPDEKVRREVSFPNMVVDLGLVRMGVAASFLQHCSVGASSTPPSPSDTDLGSQIARTTSRPSYDFGGLAEPPYYTWSRQTFRFSSGEAAGNVSEVGMHWGGGSSVLFSRALVLDTEGNPTTITVQSDEILEVTYEYRYYPPLGDSSGTVTFDGSIGGTYSWIMRAAHVAANTSTGNNDGKMISVQGSPQSSTGSTRGLATFTGPIGTVDVGPSGTMIDRNNGVTHVSSTGTTATFQAVAGLDNHNGMVRSCLMRMGICQFQIEFDPPIPKTPDDVLQLDFQIEWGRRDDP